MPYFACLCHVSCIMYHQTTIYWADVLNVGFMPYLRFWLSCFAKTCYSRCIYTGKAFHALFAYISYSTCLYCMKLLFKVYIYSKYSFFSVFLYRRLVYIAKTYSRCWQSVLCFICVISYTTCVYCMNLLFKVYIFKIFILCCYSVSKARITHVYGINCYIRCIYAKFAFYAIFVNLTVI